MHPCAEQHIIEEVQMEVDQIRVQHVQNSAIMDRMVQVGKKLGGLPGP